ncbi:hypothetical protein SAMN05216480_12325 [Pustulibacterium marinum]|uniref:Uncharacterized protein n=1 Tax=Pustulibacterium marinum TaxID=1224947 RepID=A0A1I7IW90_9FLAO|nr:hypothetical protein [Pustulibacterium marinum]SFU77169.1 hypothetical protein SAMN05216480_12325 [Pustulibacterium marinum]
MARIQLNQSWDKHTQETTITIPFCCKAEVTNWGNSIMVFCGREYGYKESFYFDHGSDYVNFKEKLRFKANPDVVGEQNNIAFVDYATVEVSCRS